MILRLYTLIDMYEKSIGRKFNTSICLKTSGSIKERRKHNLHAPYYSAFVEIKLVTDQAKKADVHDNLKGGTIFRGPFLLI